MHRNPAENFSVEDFIMDQSFANYYFHLDEEDGRFWKGWIAAHPEKKALVKKAGELLQTLSVTLSESEYQEELSKLTAAINKTEAKPVTSLLNWNRRPFLLERRRSVRYLVPVFVVLFFIGYFSISYFKNTSNRLSQITNTGNNPLVITLSDSTVVTLAPHSLIKYPSQFSNSQRNVYLEGDAGFHVKRDVSAPFKVYTENMVTTVLGTVFNIKRSGDTALTVDLLKGKLNVEMIDTKTITGSILLSPGESAVYVKTSQQFYKRSLLQRFALSFYQAEFKDIAAQIKKVFGITVFNQANKKQWRFTGDFKNNTAKEIMEAISEVENLSCSVVGDTILIK